MADYRKLREYEKDKFTEMIQQVNYAVHVHVCAYKLMSASTQYMYMLQYMPCIHVYYMYIVYFTCILQSHRLAEQKITAANFCHLRIRENIKQTNFSRLMLMISNTCIFLAD